MLASIRSLVVVVLALGVGCGKDAKCVEGTSVACACTSGGSGAQVCTAKGTFGPCSCGGPAESGSCTEESLKCERFSTGGLGPGERHNKAYEANNAKQYAKAICFATKNFNAGDDVLKGMSHFEASRGWNGLSCKDLAVSEIEKSLEVRPHGRNGWKEACDWCKEVGGTCAPCDAAAP